MRTPRSGLLSLAYPAVPCAVILSLTVAAANAQSLESIQVDERRLRAHAAVLAADSLEGRGAGYRGDSLAAQYIAAHFRRLGLLPMGDVVAGSRGYLQRFALHPRRPTVPFDVRPTQNVVAVLQGSDPVLRDEVVVVGGHYDGQGADGQANMGRRASDTGDGRTVWPSANDNAAAVVAMLDLAEMMASNGYRPRRSIVFIAFGAEEHGLVGSLHYTANPGVPWDRHVAMINLEMLGWDADSTLNVRATATSADWPALLDSATARTGLPVTRRMPALTNDTDHYGFSVNGVPSIHYGVGGSREHYHTVNDTDDRLAYPALAARTRHIYALTTLVADRATRPVFSWQHPRDAGITGTALTREESGAVGIDTSRSALKITATAAGLPAAAAGLRAGDVITAVGGQPFARRENAIQVIRQRADALPAGGGVLEVTVLRNRAPVPLTLRFAASDGSTH